METYITTIYALKEQDSINATLYKDGEIGIHGTGFSVRMSQEKAARFLDELKFELNRGRHERAA